MKKGIHPDYHKVKVIMTNGDTFETRSTYGKEGDSIQLDIDIKTHPAWTGGGAVLNSKKGKVADFNKKFGAINFSTKKAAPSEAEDNSDSSDSKDDK